MLQDSTNDPQKILAALQPQRFTAAIQDTESAHMVMEAQKFREQMSRDYCKFCACEAYGSTTDSPQCSGATGRLTATLLSVGERSMYLDQDFLLGLKELVKATASMPTGKAIIFVSDGFNRFPGRELYAIMDGYGPKNRLFQFNPRDAEPPLQAVLKLAAASNVRFYTIDSRGLYAAASLGSSSFDASNGGICSLEKVRPEPDDRRSRRYRRSIATGAPNRREHSLKMTMTYSKASSVPSLIRASTTCSRIPPYSTSGSG